MSPRQPFHCPQWKRWQFQSGPKTMAWEMR